MYWPKSRVQIVVSILLTLAFLASGIMKLAGAEEAKAAFQGFGYPMFFMYVIGLCEVAGAIGLWLGRFSYTAKMCLILLMAGAVGTHLVFDTIAEAVPPFILILLTAVTLGLHHREQAATP